jgi:hypothetical protein
MRLVTLTTLTLLMSTGVAFAGPGAGPPKEPADPAAGRPSAILDDAKCTSVWNAAQKSGDTLSEGQAAPFVTNFKLVDADGNGTISEAEFKDGCKKGLVQESASSQQPSGKETPRDKQQPAGETAPTPSPQ